MLPDLTALFTTGIVAALVSASLSLIVKSLTQRRRRKKDKYLAYFDDLNMIRSNIWSVEKYDMSNIEARGEVVGEDFEQAIQIFNKHNAILLKYEFYFDVDLLNDLNKFKKPIEDFYFHEKWLIDDSEYNSAHMRAWEHTFKFPQEMEDAIDEQISRIRI